MPDMLETLRADLAKAQKALADCDDLPVKEYMVAWRTHNRTIDLCREAIKNLEKIEQDSIQELV